MIKKLLFLLLAVACTFSAKADSKNGIVYVKQGSNGTGASWTDALGDIQAAISLANTTTTAPKDVWVATGEYPISTTIILASNVNLYGGFAGTEAAITERAKEATGKAWDFTNATILKGTGYADPTKGQRIMEATGILTTETFVDGFTLTGGNSTNNKSFPGSAGAILMRGNTTLQNAIVKGNIAPIGNGGGINMTGGTVQNCYIGNNIAAGGGGIYSNPAAATTGATAVPACISIIQNCTIENNKATSYTDPTTNKVTVFGGGAVRSQGSTNTYLKNNIIVNNQSLNGTAFQDGGAIYINSITGHVTNCVIANNAGKNAIYMNGGELINSTITNNVGGVYIASTSAVSTLINNVVWGCATTVDGTSATGVSGTGSAVCSAKNNATYTALPVAITKENNLLLPSNNTNGEVADATTDIKSGPKFVKVTTFKGNATTDAQLEEIKAANWAIGKNSPLIDKGASNDNTANDILGKVRPLDKFDIGAYEFIAENASTGIANTIDSNISIYSAGNTIFVNNANGATAYVYSLVGQLVKTSSEQSFAISQAGTYIVKCGNKVSKVMIAQ